jgi:dTDP-4-amino-4,6-dideoxygalactose transaminase
MDSQSFILGAEVENFEKDVAAFCESKFAIGVSSGTDALLASLMALDVKEGDEVITTPFSFFATVGSILRVGAKPVFVDIDPVTYNIDPKLIEAAITPKTKAIMPVHLFGQAADMDSIMAIARKHKLLVIEDTAQSIGCQTQAGNQTGSVGDVGCFSFFPSKNLGAFGDGGLITTQNEELAKKIKIFRNHGMDPKYYHKYVGGNFRIDALQAAVLRVKLQKLQEWTEMRQRNAKRYEKIFAEKKLLDKVDVRLPKAVYSHSGAKNYHIYNQFCISVPKRDQLREFLTKNNVGCEIYYPVPFHMQECLRYLGHKKGDYPHTEYACEHILALPIYSELVEEQQHYVVDTIAAFYNSL